MSDGRTATVVVLGILLTLTLSLGNVVFAAHSTILDPDYTKEAIEEADGYEALANDFGSAMAGESASAENQSEGDTDSLQSLVGDDVGVDEAVTAEYARAEFGANIDRLYAYLHGDADRLNLSLDAGPIAENVSDATEAAVSNASTAELFGAMGDGSTGDLPIEKRTLERLDEGPDAYRSAQEDVRSDLREAVLDDAVERAYQERSNDELLSLVIADYEPDDYSEAEKEQMVAEREGEIKAALRTHIERERAEQVESTVDDQLASLADEAKNDEISTGTPTTDEPANRLKAAVVDALVGDIDHATYQERTESARADLATAVGGAVEEQFVTEYGSTIDLNEAMGIDEQDGRGGAVTAVTWFDRLAIVLPILVVGVIGLVYYVTRSVARTAATTGWSLLGAGIPAFVAATFLTGRLPAMMGAGGDPGAITSIMIEALQGTTGHLAAQSLAMGLLGLVIVGAVLALKYDVVDRIQDGGSRP